MGDDDFFHVLIRKASENIRKFEFRSNGMQQTITIVIQHLLRVELLHVRLLHVRLLHVRLLHVWCGLRLRLEHLADLATGRGRQMRTGRLATLS